MKQDEKAYQAKNKIMAAAMALFAQKGYEQTTMQDIVETSKMSKGAIYHYFTSKQEILRSLTDSEKNIFSEYLKELAGRSDLTARQKIGEITSYLFGKEALSALTKQQWADKVPYALLDTLRNSLSVLAPCLEEILRQGNDNNEFCCAYPRELAGVLVLLVDLWLDPAIVACSYEELCGKVDFLILLADKFNTPIFSEDATQQIKEGLRHYYE